VLSGSYVYATGANSEVYMRARNALVVSGALAPKAQAIVKADELVHLAAPTVSIMGQVEAGLVAVNPADAANVDADRSIDMKGLSLTAGQAYTVRIAHGPVASETVRTFTETLGTPLTQTLEQLVAALAAKIDADAAYVAVVDNTAPYKINVTSGAGTARISISLGGDSASGRVLFNAGTALTVGGIVSSNDRIDMNAGVDLSWSRAQLEGAILASQLRGGTLTVSGNGLISAGGAVSLQAGGSVVLDAQAAVTAPRAVSIERLVTVAETVDVVVGETSVAVGQVQVPEYSWIKTQITEQVGTERVKVGSTYTTMDVTLTQTGYYNPKATADAQFREVLVEGLDYFNSSIDWNNNGTEGRASVTFSASELTNLRTVDQKNKTAYKGFTQLTDAQRQAVLNQTGYMALYQFGYSNAVKHQTLNGNVTSASFTPSWNNNTEKVFFIDVAGWRDKYVRMPVGAEADILRVTSQAEALYLAGDTTNDGQSDGQWKTATDIAALTTALSVSSSAVTITTPVAAAVHDLGFGHIVLGHRRQRPDRLGGRGPAGDADRCASHLRCQGCGRGDHHHWGQRYLRAVAAAPGRMGRPLQGHGSGHVHPGQVGLLLPC
jgi:hypothetical protein